ncbi:MAG: ornithine carbamoyltransferase [Desulfobacterales bacterium]|nr:ornithine carbamoyltransferase [Desulfobacterales bacterium]
MNKDIRSLLDLTKENIDFLLNRAIELKKRHKKGISDNSLAGKSVGLIFDKASTRTRISFETATIQLGATPIFMNAKDMQLSRSEPIKDTARVLSRYIDALVLRTYEQDLIDEFSEYSSIPVINALSDMYHPCQILSDIMTVVEAKGDYNQKIVWIGDGNNVAHSWINAASILGFELVLACPKGYYPDDKILKDAQKKNNKIVVVEDPFEAIKDADVVNTDVWASMGQESEQKKREKAFAGYEVNSKLLEKAKIDKVVMHCLPAHRGEEISEEVLEGEFSVVWDQAENKRHMHKSILETLINNNK